MNRKDTNTEKSISIQVAYILYNDPLYKGLIVTQVVHLLSEIKRQAPHIQITLISLLPPWVVIQKKHEINKMNLVLAKNGIKLEIFPLAIPYRFFLFDIHRVRVVRWLSKLLFRIILRQRFDIVHSRSYFPSLITTDLQLSLGYRSIFDMRSLLPDEHVSAGTWTEKDLNYLEWKNLENGILDKADAAIAVSAPMANIINNCSTSALVELIPCCVNTEIFKFNLEARHTIRKKNEWENRLIVAFEGNIGMINKLEINMKYFQRIKNIVPNALFLLLTSSKKMDISNALNNLGIHPDQVIVICATPNELGDWLSAADIGLITMGPGPDSQTRLSVKFVEYLSCGLPVICNSYVGGAAAITREYGVGAVIDRDNQGLIDFFSSPLPRRDHCRRVAEELFSVEVCANRYKDLYHKLYRLS